MQRRERVFYAAIALLAIAILAGNTRSSTIEKSFTFDSPSITTTNAGVVEISADRGETWNIISPVGSYPARASSAATIFLPPYTSCYSGQINWEFEEFDL